MRKVVVLEYDEYKTIKMCLSKAKYNLGKIEDSYFKMEAEREIEEAEKFFESVD